MEFNSTKEYVLKLVSPSNLSSDVLTPGTIPKVTQTSVGLYAVPNLNYVPEKEQPKFEVVPIPDVTLDKMTNEAKGFWVDPPTVNADFTHRLFRMFNKERENYNPNRFCTPQLFTRSYNCELSRVIEKRRAKIDLEAFNVSVPPPEITAEDIAPNVCKKKKPFWWKGEEPEQGCGGEADKKDANEEDEDKDDSVIRKKRWMEDCGIINTNKLNTEERLAKMRDVGRLFRSSACRFYYENFPREKLSRVENYSKIPFPVYASGNL